MHQLPLLWWRLCSSASLSSSLLSGTIGISFPAVRLGLSRMAWAACWTTAAESGPATVLPVQLALYFAVCIAPIAKAHFSIILPGPD